MRNATGESHWTDLTENTEESVIFWTQGSELITSLKVQMDGPGLTLIDLAKANLYFEPRQPEKRVARITGLSALAKGYDTDHLKNYIPFLVRLAQTKEQEHSELPVWTGWKDEDDDNWTDPPGDGEEPVDISDCSDRFLMTPVGNGKSKTTFYALPTSSGIELLSKASEAYTEAMQKATLTLLFKVAFMLTQSTCPQEKCTTLSWKSSEIYFIDHTLPPTITQIPRGWPGAGGFLVTIQPDIDAHMDIVITCGGWY